MIFQSVFPFTQEVIAEHPVMDDAAINKCLTKAENAFSVWKKMSFEQRALVFTKAAAILKNDSEILARLITSEMGKVIGEAKAEVEKCATVCKYYATHAQVILQDENRDIQLRSQ